MLDPSHAPLSHSKFSRTESSVFPSPYYSQEIDLDEEDDEDLNRAREKVMSILCKCDAKQLDGIEKIAAIYADGVKIK